MNDGSTAPRRRLSDILNGGTDSLRAHWNRTEAADDFKPLPGGTYTCRVVSGELETSKTGTPGYKVTFRVIEGEHTGRFIWHDLWLTPAALPMAKRDLSKLGVTDVDQLEQPLPPGIRCSVRVALRCDDNGNEFNRVKGFDVIGIDADPTADDDFAPTDDEQAEGDDDNGDAAAPVTADTPPKQGDGGAAAEALIDTTPDDAPLEKVGLPDA